MAAMTFRNVLVVEVMRRFMLPKIWPDAELEATLIANFQNEAIALDRVRHPNIISRLGHGTAIDLASTTFHYIVLEFMAGGDMAARCRNRPFTIDETLAYLQQVCAGLA